MTGNFAISWSEARLRSAVHHPALRRGLLVRTACRGLAETGKLEESCVRTEAYLAKPGSSVAAIKEGQRSG